MQSTDEKDMRFQGPPNNWTIFARHFLRERKKRVVNECSIGKGDEVFRQGVRARDELMRSRFRIQSGGVGFASDVMVPKTPFRFPDQPRAPLVSTRFAANTFSQFPQQATEASQLDSTPVSNAAANASPFHWILG